MTLRDDFLPFAAPLIGDDEVDEVVAALRSGWITTGPRVKSFEDEFACYLGVNTALAVSSGTAALHLALTALRVGPSDIVVTTPMTFCSTVNVVEHTGATPVLADIDSGTLNIDPELAAAALDSARGARQLVLLPVHYGGHPCAMQALLKSAHSAGAAVVEDAAHALGAAYGETRVGAHGMSSMPRLTCFSFYATKNLATGEGGMLVGDADLVDRARRLAMHGMTKPSWQRYTGAGSWQYEVMEPGFKYNMPDLQAAIGLHQLRKFDMFQERRRQIADIYRSRLTKLPGVTLPVSRDGYTHAWHLFPLRLNLGELSISRATFIQELAARKIATSVHFIPIHLHPYYRDKYGWQPKHFPNATAEYERLVSLPIYPKLSDADIDDVCSVVEEVILANIA